ncbi:hypothetical protein NLI96_g3819 [Meripilus lineatus]|uniref:CCL2-like lectin domain-containing protein n=1 Tax=Meripilus lineatus TaxID=2056292 RepID=A0AAD5YFB8_9APHY|nr:hypothetical protein NLI96_g3819 [Physisporinus lineatus]
MSSDIPPGTYIIISRVLDVDGCELAMTFNGKSQPITVRSINPNDTTQHWVVDDHKGGPQCITPKDDRSLEAGWGDTIDTLPKGGYFWNITQDGGFAIMDPNNSINWGIENAEDGAEVFPAEKSNNVMNRWVFREIDA